MDGASKFVRGDAIAGLVILAVNVIGGILIGVMQHELPLGEAASTYTLMSIGDGLVSQIPALIISIAAGFVVSKAGVEGAADKALVTQLASNPVRFPACRSFRLRCSQLARVCWPGIDPARPPRRLQWRSPPPRPTTPKSPSPRL
jgi:flagellar biosynthesis component FlhA